jgi:hypothetical protein
MNQRLYSVILVLFCFAASYMTITHIPIANAVTSEKHDISTKNQDFLIATVNTEQGKNSISIPFSKILFNVIPNYDQNGIVKSLTLKLKPDLGSLYKKVGFSKPSQKTVFVYPLFTQAAYTNGGFYDYYNKKCDSTCLTIPIPSNINGKYSSSQKVTSVLTLLNYSYITDVDIDKNPNILKKYDKVIILHNEYVTQKEFDAITNHPNVVYLFANSLYAKVKTDYKQNTITLINGHGYPNSTITNGFGWKNDNSKYEYDFHCDNWQFYKVDNGKMLNCYPDYRVLYDSDLLQAIRN